MNSVQQVDHAYRNVHHDTDRFYCRNRVDHVDARAVDHAAPGVGTAQEQRRQPVVLAGAVHRAGGELGVDHGLEPRPDRGELDRGRRVFPLQHPSYPADFIGNFGAVVDGRSTRPTSDQEDLVRQIFAATKSLRKTEKLTGIGRRVCARIVRGIPTAAFGEHAISTSTEDEAKIIAAYRRLHSREKVAAETNFSRAVVERVAAKIDGLVGSRGLPIKYPVNEAAFDEPLSDEAAYWIGFIAADGCLAKRYHKLHIQIGLAEVDKGHLDRFLSFLSPGRPVSHSSRNGLPLHFAEVPSDRLVARLQSYGIGVHKTYGMDLKVPVEREAAFWRGMFDGDGGIYVEKSGTLLAHLIGLPNVIELFAVWVEKVVGRYCRVQKISDYSVPMARARIGGTHLPLAVLRELYRDATVYLPRKYNIWQKAESDLAGRLAEHKPHIQRAPAR